MQPESWRLDRLVSATNRPLLRVPQGTVESHDSVNDVQLIAARSSCAASNGSHWRSTQEANETAGGRLSAGPLIRHRIREPVPDRFLGEDLGSVRSRRAGGGGG